MSKFKVEKYLGLGSLLALAVACGGTSENAVQPTTPDTPNATPVTDGPPAFKGPPWMAPGANIGSWDRQFAGDSRVKHRKKIITEMKIQPGAVVADVGAGTGVMLDVLAEAVGKDGKVIALDIAPPFVDWMKKVTEKNGWSNVEVLLSKPDTTTLPDASVDVILLAAVYHHLGPGAKPLMEDFKRILKPGGSFYLLDFDRREDASRSWVLDHMKVSRDDMVNEIISFGGFKEEGSPDARFLEENFLARFVVTTP